MSQVAYGSHLQETREDDAPAFDDTVHQPGYGPARLVTYPYNSALEVKECAKAGATDRSLEKAEQFEPKQHMDGVIKRNRIVQLTMALEHNARNSLQYGDSLYRNLNYKEAQSAYLIGLCYAKRFPELRAELIRKLKETDEKLAGR